MNETLRTRNVAGALDAFRVVDRILRNRKAFFNEIREGQEVTLKIRDMVISSTIFFALYGAVMGSTSPHWQQVLASAAKLPVLFLITLIICLPSLYFFNLFFGSRLTFFQTLALVLTAITVTAVLLVSFLPIALFFWWTAPNYQFFKLLNVGIFTLTGFFGVIFLHLGMVHVHQSENVPLRLLVLWGWILIYGFVGSQMAWTLRPFFGAPGLPFELFRQMGGNFYSDVLRSIAEILGFGFVR
jgi:hypothetical protein